MSLLAVSQCSNKLAQEDATLLYVLMYACTAVMSFALAYPSKNKTLDRKTSTLVKPSPTPPCNNNSARGSIIQLQRKIGNQSVQGLVRSENNAKGSDFAEITAQPKLKISQPGDLYEQEADRIAEEVMKMNTNASVTSASMSVNGDRVDRKCSACEMKEKEEQKVKDLNISRKPSTISKPETSDKVPTHEISNIVSGGGSPLQNDVQQLMELRFGYDFRSVKIHTDERAAKSANSVNALAYTVGNDIVFGQGQYHPNTMQGSRLLAHELAHVVQQGGAVRRKTQSEESQHATVSHRISQQAGSQFSDIIQRAGDPKEIPPGFPCPTDLTPGAPAGTDLLFDTNKSGITGTHTAQLTTFVAAWTAAGSTDDIFVHGYASTVGDQGPNWMLSCNRALAVQAELIRLGIPAVHIDIVAHGESTDFGASPAANQHAVVSTRAAGIFSNPLVFGNLTPVDNFASRSNTRFGVGEVILLDFFSFPPRPAADFGGLQWNLASGGGTLNAVIGNGTGIYTAPATADTVTLELRIVSGATAGRVVVRRVISIVEPSAINITAVAGTTAPPNVSPAGGTIPAGTWGAGFLGNVFVDPKDVSFQGVEFGEGTATGVAIGTFLASGAGQVHPVNTFGPGHAGNAITGTPVSPPPDQISTSAPPAGTSGGIPFCGFSVFLWAIPWEFSVHGGPRTRFPGGFTANHIEMSTLGCEARIQKAGAGPFCRRIDGTTC